MIFVHNGTDQRYIRTLIGTLLNKYHSWLHCKSLMRSRESCDLMSDLQFAMYQSVTDVMNIWIEGVSRLSTTQYFYCSWLRINNNYK